MKNGQIFFITAAAEAVVAEKDLVVILQQLDNDLDVIVVVLDGDHTHDVCSVFSVWILAVFVRQYQTRVGLLHLCRRITVTSLSCGRSYGPHYGF